MASILQPIQQLTQPEDFVEYINSNGAIFLAVAILAIIVQMGFLGGLWIGFDSLDNDKDISPLDAQLQAIEKGIFYFRGINCYRNCFIFRFFALNSSRYICHGKALTYLWIYCS